jgi:hypothetical protein
MNQHAGKANEADQSKELRERQDRSGITPLGASEPDRMEKIQRFGGPLSNHGREADGVSSSVATDAVSAEHSREIWRGDSSDCNKLSADREIPSMSELSRSQMPSQSSIEISPGIQVRLRGADETWKAIEHDYYMPTECICCESTIFCIQDADYVLCPGCRVVSRLEGSSSRGVGGVGLGFKYEDLGRWQEEILRATGRR